MLKPEPGSNFQGVLAIMILIQILMLRAKQQGARLHISLTKPPAKWLIQVKHVVSIKKLL